MGGLAEMAWRLACMRVHGDADRVPMCWMTDRQLCGRYGGMRTSREYYAIIDRLSRGEKA